MRVGLDKNRGGLFEPLKKAQRRAERALVTHCWRKADTALASDQRGGGFPWRDLLRLIAGCRVKELENMPGRISIWIGILAATLAWAQSEQGRDVPPAPGGGATKTEGETSAGTPAPRMLSSDEIKQLIQKVADNDLVNEKKLHDYTYTERSEQRNRNGKGEVTKTETRTYEVLELYGEQVNRLVAKDDKPLSARDAAKEDEKIQKIIDKRKHESNSDREKRLKKEEKERQDGREFVKEIAAAYNFTQTGTELVAGRETYVIAAEPRPGFAPTRKEAKVLPKIRGRVWIDAAENQWVKIDAETIATISFGLFLARLHKGTHIVTEQMRVNDEVWLPRHTAVHVDVRLALLKNFDADLDVVDKDYKKFHAQTKIVGIEEMKQ